MRLIDLSTGILDRAVHEPVPASITWHSHAGGGLDWMLEHFGITADALTASGGLGMAYEDITTIAHCGTHVDAPWHYAPTSEGRPAKTIDECPLEWFYGDGVRLDLRHKRPSEKITIADLEAALAAIDYTLKPFDIVLIMNGRDRFLGRPEYFDQPGMTRESTLWLLDQGIKLIGVDMYGFDRKFSDMVDEYRRTGDGSVIWEAHFAGIEREYCHIEKLVNLDQIPAPTGFTVAAFPVKIERGSAGWCRAVAMVP